MKIGIVAEGPTDHLVLRAVVESVCSAATVVQLQPEVTLGKRGSGWIGVKRWCEEFGAKLDAVMAADQDPLDALLIHVDCSMAHNVNAQLPCPPAADTAAALQNVVLRQWLSLASAPRHLIITTPSTSSDTWTAAVVAPPGDHPQPLECASPNEIGRLLADNSSLRMKNGALKKSARQYEELASLVAAAIPELRARCQQADALCLALP